MTDQNSFADEINLTANEKHKSSVFSMLFSKPEILRELYSAIEGVDLPPDIPIDINTLSNAVIKGKINDISFLIDKRLVVLFEHQSTINENMPLRMLEYINRIYKSSSDYRKVYQEKRIKIPRPEFIVLYNGEKPYPEKSELKLSDSFMDIEKVSGNRRFSLELVANVYNINHGHNLEIQQKCKTLSNYSYFINKIREYQKDELSLANSVEYAIKYCVENNILKDFLKEHGSEVVSMLFYDYDIDTHLEVRYEEGREEEREEIARNALAKGYSIEAIHDITGLAPEIICELEKSIVRRSDPEHDINGTKRRT